MGSKLELGEYIMIIVLIDLNDIMDHSYVRLYP